jgi:AraC-like DNA-binding protein
VLIEEGFGKLHMNNQVYEAKKGVIIYIPPGKWHGWEASRTEPMIHRCAYFDWQHTDRIGFTHQNDYFCYSKSELKEQYYGPQIHANVLIQEYSVVKNINAWLQRFDFFTSSPELLDESYFPASLEIRGYFQLFLHHFIKYMMEPASVMDPRVKKSIEWMNEVSTAGSFDEVDRLIETCADKIGLSCSHFHALFKEQTGFSPKAYWNNNLLLRAKVDLKYSNLTITEIAVKYGFSSIHYFSKMFRKKMGCTPSEYRSRNRIY